MSRLKRLKEKRKKQFIKTAMSSLALTLTIGSMQTMTTYAWFTDSENINNDLVITMGNLVVNIGDGFNVTELDRKDNEYKNFNITNTGTLKQHIRLKLDGISDEILKYINYEIKFEQYNGNNIKTISNEELLSENEVSLKYENGSLVVLQPKDIIKATADITIDENMPKDLINLFVESPLKFNLDVRATQVNDENTILGWGFSDIDTQVNSLQFNKIIEPVLPQEGNVDIQLVADEYTVKIFINKISEIDNKNISKIQITGGTGEFEENIEVKHDNDNIVFIQKIPIGDFNITNTEFDDSNTLNLKFIMNDGTYKEIKIRFRINHKNQNKYDLEAYYEVISSGKEVPSEQEEVEPPKEEVEVPTEPEVVEPPKEEVEVPSEPEAVEPPKEEIEVPSEQEEVESPKEEVEIPSEPEVVEPPKEEIIEIPNQPEIV